MAAAQGGPDPDDRSPAAGRSQQAQEPGSERYGPLLVARGAKDDGRALLLYSRAPDGRA